MQIGFKAMALMMIALASTQPVTANEAVDVREMPQAIRQALATGIVDAEIQRSCLIQTMAENREYVANEAECRESLNELQAALSEGEGLDDQILQVKRFRMQYDI